MITSTANEKVRQMKALASKKAREETGCFLIEGKKVLFEAIESGISIKSVFGLQRFFDGYGDKFDCELYCVDEKVLQCASDVKTPNDVIACAVIPEHSIEVGKGLYVMLDGVQDPSNVGAILRCADAMGAAGVFLGEGCADVYCPKAVRAAMGSTFHLPVAAVDLGAQLDLMEGYAVIAAMLGGKGELPEALGDKAVLLIGSEGKGLKPELCERANIRYRLRMKGKAESLNAAVAAGIMLYELSRRME